MIEQKVVIEGTRRLERTPIQFDTTKRALKYYQCGGSGHVARECERVKCYACGQEGHLKRDCRSVMRETTDKKLTHVRVVEKESAFKKIVTVEDKTFEALIDTGAKVSTIQEKWVNNFGIIKPSDKTLKGFGQVEVKVKEKVCAKVSVDNVVLSVELQIVPSWVQNTAIILGEDVLEQDGLVMIKRNNQLVFSLDKNTNIHNEDEILELDIFTIEGTEPIEGPIPIPIITTLTHTYTYCYTRTPST